MSRTFARLPWVLGLGLALWMSLPTPALANGRAPSMVSIHPRQGSAELAIWSTWGLLRGSGDSGFRWMCENALKVGGAFDPDLVFRADGALVASTFEGLLINRDGCVFEPTGLGAKFISQVAEGPDGALYAAAVERSDGKIYKSTDGGRTFPISANPGMSNDWWESLEVAPSDASRVYLAGYRLMNGTKQQLSFRSDDGGVSFTPKPLPQAVTGLASDLEIAAISPKNANLVFARVTYAMGDDKVGDRIYRSDNGGDSWTEVLYAAAALPNVVVRRDGKVLVASVSSGSWRSDDGGVTFVAQASTLQMQCLVEREDGTLLACGQNFAPDFMAVAQSSDGATWSKVFRFAEARGPVDCAVGTLQCDTCQLLLWCGLREQFGIEADPTTCGEDGGDGTTCGGPLPKVEEPASGCCGAGGTAGGDAGGGPASPLLLAVMVLGLWRWRIRRQRA